MGEDRQYKAKTIEVALSKAARDLDVPRETVHHEVSHDGRKGLFGFGQRDVIIRVDVQRTLQAASAMATAAASGEDAGPLTEKRSKSTGPVAGEDGFDRPSRGDRPDRDGRSPRGDRGDRPPRRDRDDRGGRGRRPRGERRDGFGRDDDRRGGGRRGGGGRDGRDGRQRGGSPSGGQSEGRRGPREDRGETFEAPPLPPPPPPETEPGRQLLAFGEELVEKLGLDLDCGVREEPDRLVLEFSGADEAIVIGRRGDVLEAFQYVVNRIVTRDEKYGGMKASVDSAGYRRRHDMKIEETARRSARSVRDNGRPVQLEPMNPYQRRVVHMALRDEPGIRTYSTGEGFMRRLTIAPADPAGEDR